MNHWIISGKQTHQFWTKLDPGFLAFKVVYLDSSIVRNLEADCLGGVEHLLLGDVLPLPLGFLVGVDIVPPVSCSVPLSTDQSPETRKKLPTFQNIKTMSLHKEDVGNTSQ